ncbi:syntaxin [Trypanosoma rangeli]|uniref:Syntaxin n=1 Tax=Trypanosoma rangeli TaxID=5698 RepID=A0A3R7NXH1_TRYRA|nr:syntaxin [Trypanosoma rangeli]RNF09255.1 syntaxin [Trypanosoma rangeli]|eukprot:RNF09255.1 syntaxin [Trypanosoma rangeli]
MEDPSWRRNCDLLTDALQSLDRSTSQIRRSTNKLTTLRDIARERERVKQVTGSTNAKEVHSIQDALGLMEKYMRLNPAQLRGQGVKLTTEAKVAMERYQNSCDAFYKKCISVEQSLRSSQGTTHVKVLPGSQVSSDADEADETSDLLQKGAAGALTQKEIFERDLHDDIMAERRRETLEIADNVKDINEIFNHIHLMVEEQGDSLDVIEGNVGMAQQATRNAAQHLRQAQQYQETPKRNKFLLLFAFVLAFIVFFTVLFH